MTTFVTLIELLICVQRNGVRVVLELSEPWKFNSNPFRVLSITECGATLTSDLWQKNSNKLIHVYINDCFTKIKIILCWRVQSDNVSQINGWQKLCIQDGGMWVFCYRFFLFLKCCFANHRSRKWCIQGFYLASQGENFFFLFVRVWPHDLLEL